MFKRSLFVTLLTLSNSFLGFVVQLIMARKFDSASELDYYFYSLSYPLFIASIFVSVYSYSLIPKIVQADFIEKKTIISSMVWFCLIIVLFFCFFSPKLVQLQVNVFSENYSFDTKKINIDIFYIATFIGILQVMQGLIISILNGIGKQLQAVYMLSIPYVFMLVFLLLFYNIGVLSVSLGMLLGVALSIFFGFLLIKNYIIITFNFKLVRDFYKKGFLIALALTCFSSYSVIDAYWATQSGSGVLTTMNYAQRLLIALGNLVVAAPSVLFLPKFVLMMKDKRYFEVYFYKAVFAFLSYNFTIWFFYYFISQALINALFLGGEFGPDNAQLLYETNLYMLPGVFCMLNSVILFRLLYCFEKTELIAACVGCFWSVIYFSFCWKFYQLGAVGLAVSYSFTWVITFVFLGLIVLKNIRGLSYE